jgi:hypothetical protein
VVTNKTYCFGDIKPSALIARRVTRTLAPGTSAVADALVAGIDPSEMANGPYILTLRAVDGSGHETTLSQVVTVKSQYKVGNFRHFTSVPDHGAKWAS